MGLARVIRRSFGNEKRSSTGNTHRDKGHSLGSINVNELDNSNVNNSNNSNSTEMCMVNVKCTWDKWKLPDQQVSVPPTALVSELKAQLSQNLGIPASQQVLALNGKKLKDSKTLSHYGITAISKHAVGGTVRRASMGSPTLEPNSISLFALSASSIASSSLSLNSSSSSGVRPKQKSMPQIILTLDSSASQAALTSEVISGPVLAANLKRTMFRSEGTDASPSAAALVGLQCSHFVEEPDQDDSKTASSCSPATAQNTPLPTRHFPSAPHIHFLESEKQ